MGISLSRHIQAPFSTGESAKYEILESSNLKNFSFSDLKLATRNFRPDSVVGEGGFGSVFKGWIDENSFSATKPGTGIAIAVKRLSQDSFQGHSEWLAGVDFLGQLDHPHLVKLIGYCLEGEKRFLVYEFMPGGGSSSLSWSLRLKVALGAAKGLAFLHSAERKLIYRDLPSNILLDSSYNAKLWLAKDDPTIVRVAYGYEAPEYIFTGHVTARSDVFSFGVVLLEMLSGRRAVDRNRPSCERNLVVWAKPYLANKRKIFPILDSRLEGQYSMDAAHKVGTVASLCLSTDPKFRPTMYEVVAALEELQDSNGNGSNNARSVA